MNQEESKRIGKSAKALAEWLDANHRSTILEGLRIGVRRSHRLSNVVSEELYGHALERLTLNASARNKLLLCLSRGADPARFLMGVAKKVGLEATRTRSIERETVQASNPEFYDQDQPIPFRLAIPDYSPECLAEVKVALSELSPRIRRIIRERLFERRSCEYLSKKLSNKSSALSPSDVKELFEEGIATLQSKLDHLRP